jgi:hypothetical protein
MWVASNSIKPIEIPQKLKNTPTVAKIAGDCLENLANRSNFVENMPNNAKAVKMIRVISANTLVGLIKTASII